MIRLSPQRKAWQALRALSGKFDNAEAVRRYLINRYADYVQISCWPPIHPLESDVIPEVRWFIHGVLYSPFADSHMDIWICIGTWHRIAYYRTPFGRWTWFLPEDRVVRGWRER